MWKEKVLIYQSIAFKRDYSAHQDCQSGMSTRHRHPNHTHISLLAIIKI